MKLAPKNRVQRTLAVSAAALTALGATGCSAVNEQATTIQYSPSDGIVENVGPLELRNILIITSDEGEPGTILGTVFNTADSPVQLTIDGENESSQVTIEGDGKYVFEDEVADDGTLQGISEIPGSLVDIGFTVDGETVETTELRVPVLDGTLEAYREFVPGGYTPDPTPPAEPEPAEELELEEEL